MFKFSCVANGADWAEIRQKENIAVGLRGSSQVSAYRSLCHSLADFINEHVPSDTERYVQELCRMGVFSQHANWPKEALLYFQECKFHSLSKSASWNGETVFDFVSKYERGGVITVIEQKKDRIIISEGAQDGAVIDAKKMATLFSYTSEDSTKTLLTGQWILKEKLAINDPSTTIKGRFVVFGISSSGNDHVELAKTLSDAEKRITEVLTLAPSKRVIPVYANFSNDPNRLNGLHGLTVKDTGSQVEGYFMPVDNSIVLNQGLKFGERLFFGTPVHELSHALIYRDYPGAPMWLEEGAASLFEENNRGEPIDNYRLYYLRSSNAKLPSMKEFVTEQGWWSHGYRRFAAAFSRYLAFFLYERDSLGLTYTAIKEERHKDAYTAIRMESNFSSAALLEEAFHEFVKNRDVDRITRKWGRLRRPIDEYVALMKTPPRDSTDAQSVSVETGITPDPTID